MREWDEDTVLLGDANESIGQNQETMTEHDALRSDRRLQLKAHRMALKAMYHVETEMALEWSNHAKDFLPVLAATGQYYGCSEIIDARVDYFLRCHSERVLSDCADSSLEMLELGLATRSEWVTIECFAYLIGASNDKFTSMLPKLKELEVAKLLKKKRIKMVNKLKSMDLKLLSLMFEGTAVEQRFYYQQIALSVWRQWIANELWDGHGSKMEDSYAQVYRRISPGVNRHILLHTIRPDIVEADDIEEAIERLDELFYRGEDIVRPILKDRTKLQRERSLFTDLLFSTIPASELPWKVTD